MSEKELEELRSEVASLRAELAATSQNRDSILREKRDLQTKLRETKAGDGADAYTLTLEEARDPRRYRAAKEAAQRAGRKAGPIIIDPNAEAAEQRAAQTIRTDQAIYAHEAVGRDVRAYRRLREEATRDKKTFRLFNDRANLAAISGNDEAVLADFDRTAADATTEAKP